MRTGDYDDDFSIADRGALAVDTCGYGGKQQQFVVNIELKQQALKEVPKRRVALRALLKATCLRR